MACEEDERVALSVVSFTQLSTHRATVGNFRFEDDTEVFDIISPDNMRRQEI